MSAANIHEELLALLDKDQAASCISSLPPLQPRQQLSRRGGGGSSSQQPSADGPTIRSSDRSVPPTFKYWAASTSNTKQLNRKSKYPTNDQACGGGGRKNLQSSSRHHGQSRSLSGPVLMQYFALISIGVCTYFYSKVLVSNNEGQTYHFFRGATMNTLFLRSRGASHQDRIEPGALPQSIFIDPTWRGIEEGQFETLVSPSDINFSVQRRLRVEEERNCDDILLYLPRVSSSATSMDQEQGIRNELKDYFLAALLATSMGKAMVVLENPITSDVGDGNNSWFDCPVDTFSKSEPLKSDFPSGLSRLIRHPKWLSRGCPVPCQTSYDFSKWNDLCKQHIQQVTCQNDSDRQASVFALSKDDVRHYFKSQWTSHMSERSSAAAYDWAIRLGAQGYEALTFAKLQKEEDVWNYVSALMARSGVFRFQPWIARDIKRWIESSKLSLNSPYISVYLHGGDDLLMELREDDVGAILSDQSERKEKNIPLNIILHQWDRRDCNVKSHTVYIVTDDPQQIQEEINRFLKDQGGITSPSECHRLHFIVSPTKSTPHVDVSGMNDCSLLHRVNIAEIADVMILARSDTFVEELNSSFGSLVRVFRTAVNNFPGRSQDGPVLVRNAKVAFGAIYPGPQAML